MFNQPGQNAHSVSLHARQSRPVSSVAMLLFTGVLPPSGSSGRNAQLVTPLARFQIELSRFVCVCGASVLLNRVALFVAFALFCPEGMHT